MTIDNDILTTIQRELGYGVACRFIETRDSSWWCELRLPVKRFDCRLACCPGSNRLMALQHSISQAKRHMRRAA